MNRRVLAVLVVVSATVLAGCGAFGGPESPTVTPETASVVNDTSETATPPTTPDSRVRVYGDLPVNATLVWERVNSLFDGEYEAPLVVVREDSSGVVSEPVADSFATHLGLTEGGPTYNERRVGGEYSWTSERVTIVPRNGSAEEVSRVLAHEYVHAIQYQSGFSIRVADGVTGGVYRVVVEGSAVYAAEEYARDGSSYWSLDRRCERYRNGTPYERYVTGSYCFGGRYFAETLDSPSDLLDSDLQLPNTTEQVLHPGSSDLPANITVIDETPSEWNAQSDDRRGELFVRTALGVELSEERAVDAAAGWGNDRLLTVTGDTEGYVWVLRWDTGEDADAFENAFADYLDARGNKTADGWTVDDDRYRLSTIDERTVAVVTGNETFVESVIVTKEDKNITVSADESV